jgi:hypothetical protein
MDLQGVGTRQLEVGRLLKGAAGPDNEGDASGAFRDRLEQVVW